jgi:hypothetical protein
LRKEILLLPDYLLNPDCGVVDCIDSNVTNNHADNAPQFFWRRFVAG